MKNISMLVVALVVFMTGFARMDAKAHEVVLNASQVFSAVDIESAILTATNNGTRPGIVTLDASEGDFIYAASEYDRTIDIPVSNITLRSMNGAVIRNCDNGVFLDTSTTHHITLEGITFYCHSSGVLAWPGHQNITVRNNTFYVFAYGVYVHQGKAWRIEGNYVESPPTSVYPEASGAGVYILDSSKMDVNANTLIAGSGVVIRDSVGLHVLNNEIDAVWFGILLGNSASYNIIRGNQILNTQEAGIVFRGGNEFNIVRNNSVHCTWSYDCLLYFVDETYTPLSPTNKVTGNKLIPAADTDTFSTKLLPGFWRDFKLGPTSEGTVHVVDVTPLQHSVDGAHTPFMIVPYYDGEQWIDLLRVTVPLEAASEDVQISVYTLSGLPTVMDSTDSLYPGERRSYPISPSTDNVHAVYFADLDPLAPSVEAMYISDFLIRPEFMDGQWKDALLIQMPSRFEPDPLHLHLQVHAADFLPLVADFHATLTRNDSWIGFGLAPSSFERGYVVRLFPVSGDNTAAVDYYMIQPEFNGSEWYDVLRIRMGNLGVEWQSMEYNIKVYACEEAGCS